MSATNLAARLGERAQRDPDRTALVAGDGTRLTFGGLSNRVGRLAAGLRAAGIGPGDRALVFVPMSPDLYVALLALWHVGAVAVFVDAWADRSRLDRAVQLAHPTLLIGTPKAHLLRLVSPAIRRIPTHWVAGRRWLRLSRYERPDAGRPPAERAASDPALVTFTTGSTGNAKAAARAHGFLWAQHLALAHHLGLVEGDVDLTTLPVFVLNNLALGVTSVLPDGDARHPAALDPARLHRQIVRERVTTAAGSPSLFGRLADWCAASGQVLPLRKLFVGGGAVTAATAQTLNRATAGEVHIVYGSTEAEPIAGLSADELIAAGDAPGLLVGRPVPEIAVRLIRPTDGPVELTSGGWAPLLVRPGEVGELVVSGDPVLPGYLDDPEADRANKIRDGATVWHRTGDGVRLDDLGRLWLMGRVSGRIGRPDGSTLWPLSVEGRALALASEVTFAALISLDGRAVLCLETADGRLSPAARAALSALPVDDLCPLRLIPRDPRHGAKPDLAQLARALQKKR